MIFFKLRKYLAVTMLNDFNIPARRERKSQAKP